MLIKELGQKRQCFDCQRYFYDLRRETIECPYCQFPYDPHHMMSESCQKPSSEILFNTDSGEDLPLDPDELYHDL